MTAQQTRKIIEAIAECDRFIAKEGRSAGLRGPVDIQKHLDFCKAHRVKLNAMLEALA